MKRSQLLLVAGLVLALLSGGYWLYVSQRDQAEVVASVPARPDLVSASPVLRERVGEAERAAKDGDTDGLAELSRLYHANGFLDEAVQCYEGLERLRPRDPVFPHRHASIAAGFGDTETAIRLWQQSVRAKADYAPTRLRLADALLKAGRDADAVREYEGILKDFPKEPYAQLGLARIDFEAGRLDAAVRRLEALVAQTNYTLGYDLIVTAYERSRRPEKAAAIRGMARAFGSYRDPDDPWMDELFDDCYDSYRLAVAGGMARGSGDQAKAFRLVERAVQVAPKDVSARFQLAGMLVERRDYKAAREQFQMCTELAPDFADGWAHLSNLLQTQGDAAGADRILSIGLQNCPQSPGLHMMRGRRLADQGRLPEAAEAFKNSIRYRPNEADAYVQLAIVYLKSGRDEDAKAELKKALDAEPQNPDVLGFLAIQAITQGNQSDALQWIKLLRQQPRTKTEQMNMVQSAFREKFGRSP